MKTFFVLLLAALIAIGVWERTSLAGLHAENAALREQQSSAQAFADENAALAKRLGESPRSALEGTKSELLRLRNEVRRLRSTQIDPARLRAFAVMLGIGLTVWAVSVLTTYAWVRDHMGTTGEPSVPPKI